MTVAILELVLTEPDTRTRVALVAKRSRDDAAALLASEPFPLLDDERYEPTAADYAANLQMDIDAELEERYGGFREMLGEG